ncbi:MAG: hypothetical protein M3174_04315 [Actinomycetota bacterium]|nr:hypothetical protein [Actinomycetota bacterium]
MVRHKLTRVALAASLLIGAGGLVACDNEDQRDVQEIGEEADKQLDKLDTDGKDN